MKNKKTLYHFILDSSSSMSADRVNTVNMFNKQVTTVKSLASEFPDQQFLAGLTIFNQEVNHILQETPANQLRELSYDRYFPNGMTALFDAIGESTVRIREKFGSEILDGRMSVVVIVLTDGHENASRMFDVVRIAKLIRDLEATDNWSFTILGADFDITAMSRTMNIRPTAAFNYSKADFKAMENDMSESIHAYADMKSKGFISKDFFKKK